MLHFPPHNKYLLSGENVTVCRIRITRQVQCNCVPMCLWHIYTFYRGFHLRHKSNLLVQLLARRWVTREIFSHVKILWLAQQVTTAAVIGIFAMCSWKPIIIILTWGFVMSVWWKSSKVVTNTYSKEVCQFPKVKYLLICQSTNLLQHKAGSALLLAATKWIVILAGQVRSRAK